MSSITAIQISSSLGIDPNRENDQLSPQQAVALKNSAKQFEATFLSEMLKHTGMGKERSSFGGGPGEAAFTDFLTREYAEKIAETGAVGLADHVLSVLVERASK